MSDDLPPDEQPGIKKRVAEALRTTPEAMTMGELMARANVPKTMASEVSSALYKLRNQGLIQTIRGPASSPKGPRFVRKYKWVAKPPAVERIEVPKPKAVSLPRRVYNF